MTTIYQVIHAEDIPYERNNRNVTCVSLSLDEAIEQAEKVAEKIFLNRYREVSDIFFSNFQQFLNFQNAIPNLFSIKSLNNTYFESNVYIVEVQAGEIINLFDRKHEENAVWSVDADFVFKLFCKHLDQLMERDHLDMLPIEEKELLWSKFRKNYKILKNDTITNKRRKTLGMNNRRRTTTDDFNTTRSGADVWAMTAANDSEINSFNEFER